MAQHLARLGARVCLTSRSASEIQGVLASIRAEGGEGAAITADVTLEEDVQRLFEAAHGELGPVSILVNNAGEGLLQPFADTSLEQWNQCVASNMTSMFLCSREAFRRMPGHGGGDIVNVSSLAGKTGIINAAAYCAAKSGTLGLARALAREGARVGIRVNSVCPGATRTQMRQKLFGSERRETLLEPDEVAAAVTMLLCEGAASSVRGAEIDLVR